MQFLHASIFVVVLALLPSSGDCKRPKQQELERPANGPTGAASQLQVDQKSNLLAVQRSGRAEAATGREQLAQLASQAANGIALMIDGKPAQAEQVHVTKYLYLNGKKISTEGPNEQVPAAKGSLQQQHEGKSASDTEIDLAINLNVVTDDCAKLSSKDAFSAARSDPASYFKCYDVNSDQKLSSDELKSLFNDMGSVVQDPSSYLGREDRDKDGSLSQDEFTQLVIDVSVDIDIQIGNA